MAETLGSLIDKVCIAELKIFHMQEQVGRSDVTEDHREMCRQRVAVLRQQRDDLVGELNQTRISWTDGEWKPKVYRQYKMYNDPRFRMKPRA